MPWIDRRMNIKVLEALKISPVVYLNGPRQSGKSTLAQDIIKHNYWTAEYITFDSPTQMAGATAAPEAFLSARKGNLVIDEVQLVPELFRALKIVVDDLRMAGGAQINGKFLLTGSANVLALPKLSDPLVGRMSVLTLYPYCTAEAYGCKGDGLERLLQMDFSGMVNKVAKLTDAIQRATFPEISGKSQQEQTLWFDGYVSTILQRDVRTLAELDKISLLPNLLRILATRAGGLINDADIAREVGLNSVTGKQYRHILKMMFLNFDVPPWYRNVGKRLVKAPKGYLTDTLLLCYMLGYNIEDIEKNRPELFGHILENFVATELVKLLSFTKTKMQLHNFRTSDGKEVDFVLEKQDGTIFAIEVKKKESVSIDDFKGIKVLEELAKNEFIGGVVLYAGKDIVPFGKNLWAVPYSILWQ